MLVPLPNISAIKGVTGLKVNIALTSMFSKVLLLELHILVMPTMMSVPVKIQTELSSFELVVKQLVFVGTNLHLEPKKQNH